METTLLLAPLMVIMLWFLFVVSESLMTSLLAMLATSMVLPVMYMKINKFFWPCGLLVILMTTGLIVVFAYIVSLHSLEMPSTGVTNVGLLGVMVLAIFWIFPRAETLGSKAFSLLEASYVSVGLSLTVIFILLFLVVFFVRLVYSKGGGFREKF